MPLHLTCDRQQLSHGRPEACSPTMLPGLERVPMSMLEQ